MRVIKRLIISLVFSSIFLSFFMVFFTTPIQAASFETIWQNNNDFNQNESAINQGQPLQNPNTVLENITVSENQVKLSHNQEKTIPLNLANNSIASQSSWLDDQLTLALINKEKLIDFSQVNYLNYLSPEKNKSLQINQGDFTGLSLYPTRKAISEKESSNLGYKPKIFLDQNNNPIIIFRKKNEPKFILIKQEASGSIREIEINDNFNETIDGDFYTGFSAVVDQQNNTAYLSYLSLDLDLGQKLVRIIKINLNDLSKQTITSTPLTQLGIDGLSNSISIGLIGSDQIVISFTSFVNGVYHWVVTVFDHDHWYSPLNPKDKFAILTMQGNIRASRSLKYQSQVISFQDNNVFKSFLLGIDATEKLFGYQLSEQGLVPLGANGFLTELNTESANSLQSAYLGSNKLALVYSKKIDISGTLYQQVMIRGFDVNQNDWFSITENNIIETNVSANKNQVILSSLHSSDNGNFISVFWSQVVYGKYQICASSFEATNPQLGFYKGFETECNNVSNDTWSAKDSSVTNFIDQDNKKIEYLAYESVRGNNNIIVLKKIIRRYSNQATVVTIPLLENNDQDIWKVLLEPEENLPSPQDQQINYFISVDNGDSFQPINKGIITSLEQTGQNLMIKVVIESNLDTDDINLLPLLKNIKLTTSFDYYQTGSLITDNIDLGINQQLLKIIAQTEHQDKIKLYLKTGNQLLEPETIDWTDCQIELDTVITAGNCVDPDHRWAVFKIELNKVEARVSPSLSSLSQLSQRYQENGQISHLIIDTQEERVFDALKMLGDLPESTSIWYQVRVADSQEEIETKDWSTIYKIHQLNRIQQFNQEYLGKVIELRIILQSDPDNYYTPVIDQLLLRHIKNLAPQLEINEIKQVNDGDFQGWLKIDFNLADFEDGGFNQFPDQRSTTYNGDDGMVKLDFFYSLDQGQSWQIIEVVDSNNQAVGNLQPNQVLQNYTVFWDGRQDLNNSFKNDVLVKITADDGNLNFNLSQLIQENVRLDYTPPIITDFSLDATPMISTSKLLENGSQFNGKVTNSPNLTLNIQTSDESNSSFLWSWQIDSNNHLINPSKITIINNQTTDVLNLNFVQTEEIVTIYGQVQDEYANLSQIENKQILVDFLSPEKATGLTVSDASDPNYDDVQTSIVFSRPNEKYHDISFYRIYRGTDNNNLLPLKEIYSVEGQPVAELIKVFTIDDNNLFNQQQYYYAIETIDLIGNSSGISETKNIAIGEENSDGFPDKQPDITEIETNVWGNSVLINWKTDIPANSKVVYSQDENNLADKKEIADLDINHSILFESLTEASQYYYKIVSSSETNKQSESQVLTFTTDSLNTGTNMIQNGAPDVRTETNSAVLSFITTKPVLTEIIYGLDENLSLSFKEDNLASNHLITLEALEAGKRYFYQLKLTDEQNIIEESSVFELVTKPEDGQQISSVIINEITSSSALINISLTDIGEVKIKAQSGSDSKTQTSQKAQLHSFKLTDLKPQTTYKINIEADFDNKTVNSSDYSLTTLESVKIDKIKVEALGAGKVQVNFTTNLAAIGTIFYGLNQNELNEQRGDSDYKTDHSLIIDNLNQNKNYYYYVKAMEKNGTNSQSQTLNFTTGSDSTGPEITNISFEALNSGVEANSGKIVVNFETNEPSQGLVLYSQNLGQNNHYDQQTDQEEVLTTKHLFYLGSLQTSSVYHFMIEQEDQSGNLSQSTDYIATTLEPGTSPIEIVVQSWSEIFSWLIK